MKLLFVLAIALATCIANAQDYPDPKITPGVTRVVSKKILCTHGSTKDARLVSAKTKTEVFKRYGFIKGKFKPGDYEIDHFISLELGGANDINNLWPQPFHGTHTARMKDVVETNLHRRICKGLITVEDAQNIIRTDWVAEYKRIKGEK